MKHLWNITESYEDNNGYIVDIVSLDMGSKYEAWIYRKEYGVKCFMFGMESSSITKSSFTDLVLNRYNEYIDYYIDYTNNL